MTDVSLAEKKNWKKKKRFIYVACEEGKITQRDRRELTTLRENSARNHCSVSDCVTFSRVYHALSVTFNLP